MYVYKKDRVVEYALCCQGIHYPLSLLNRECIHIALDKTANGMEILRILII